MLASKESRYVATNAIFKQAFQIITMANIRLGPKHTALTVGIFAAIMHLLWSLMVAVGVGQGWTNWMLSLHFMTMAVSVTAFSAVTMLMLLILTFVVGAVAGWIFAIVFNWIGKKKF